MKTPFHVRHKMALEREAAKLEREAAKKAAAKPSGFFGIAWSVLISAFQILGQGE